MIRFGFLLLVLAKVASGNPNGPCDDLHIEPAGTIDTGTASTYNEALESGHFQQVIWALRDRGEEAQAEKVAACLEHILRTGEVLAEERLGTGISASNKLELERGVTAVFKTTNSFKGCYRHELAAYALDQRLGLHIVPLTVERTIDGRTGSLQYFMEDAVPAHEAESARKNVELKILDILMDNEDRHAANWLIYEFDGERRVAAIDHNLTFNCRSEANLKTVSIKNLDPAEARAYRQRLESFPKSELRALLEPYVSRNRAIRKAEKARRKLIRRFEKLATAN